MVPEPAPGGTRRDRRHPALRRQLLWAFALVAAAPVLLLGLVQARSAADSESDRADRETLLASSALGRELGRVLDADAGMVRALSKEVAEQGELNPRALERAAQRYLESSKSFYTVLVIAPDGRTVAGRAGEGAGSRSVSGSYADRGYFQRVIAGEPFASELVRGKIDGRPALIMAAPIVDRTGKLFGVVAAGVDLRMVDQAVQRVTAVAPGLTSVVLDQSGRVVAASGTSHFDKLQNLGKLPLYRPSRGLEPEPRAGDDEQGIARRGMVTRVESSGTSWWVTSTWSAAAVRERALGALAATLSFGLAAVGVALLVAFWVAGAIARPMSKLSTLVEAIGRGDLRHRPEPPGATHPREVVGLSAVVSSMLGHLEQLVVELGGTVATIRSETQRLRAASNDMLEDSEAQTSAVQKSTGAIVQLTDSIDSVGRSVLDLSNTAVETTKSISSLDQEIVRIAKNIQRLTTTIDGASLQVGDVEAQVGHVADSASFLSRNVDETRQSLEALTASIRQVESRAQRGKGLARETMGAADAGRLAVQETIGATREIQTSFSDIERAVQALAGRSEAIGAVISVIDEVTRATQLLAVNASIIAAQAGEQGRGFVVVAERIKTVAGETAASTEQITKLVASVQADIGAAVKAVASGRRTVQAGQERSAEAGIRLDAIIESSSESVQTVGQIVASAEEQTRAVNLVQRALDEVHLVTAHINEAVARQREAQQRMAEAFAQVRAIGNEVHRATEAQRGESHAMAAAVSNMSARFQAIVRATQEQDKERNRIKAGLNIFDVATQSSAERARQIGEAVNALNDRLELLEQQLRVFRVR